jgi:hypothetical protein
MTSINIIPSAQLDKHQWDNCVASNTNGLIYAYSYFLDAMSTEWHGLVVNDYEAIFPLPTKKKLGLKYCYMPPFTQQLGLIGKIDMNDGISNAITSFVSYGSPYLNYTNKSFALLHQLPSLSNYIIDLNVSYETIRKGYKKSIDYSLSKAAKQDLQYVTSNHIAEAISLYKQYNQSNLLHVAKEDYIKLEALLNQLNANKQVFIRKALNNEGVLLSIVLLIKDNKRYYNLINYTTPIGRSTEANYFLYDCLFQELANNAMLFDFEGSDIVGVQSFYEKFGAINQPYFHWHFNKLPLPLKWFKK